MNALSTPNVVTNCYETIQGMAACCPPFDVSTVLEVVIVHKSALHNIVTSIKL